ncbi:HAD family hydrolase [Gracilibacillus marinus]|uniref:HAD family hydrolase n=1 Tax=Gracilibacillus marinus TaxID=630535 RepID=A0ABV8VQZ6_9BACI
MSKTIKAICLDMDGTLLNNHNQLKNNTIEAIQAIRQKGIKVFIVTGRSLDEVYDSAPVDIELDGFVTANGMITYRNGEKILEHKLTTAFVNKIIDSAREHDIYYEAHPNDGQRLALTRDKAYMNELISGDKPSEVGINEWLERKAAIEEDLSFEDHLIEQHYAKVYCFQPSQKVMKQWTEVLEEMKKDGDFTTSQSSPNNVEIMVANVNKATGIKALLQYYNISNEEVMAIGDSNNDLPMMRYVGYPVAMKNATEQLKQLVKEETQYTNDEDGVYHYLTKFFLSTK